jgi:predicted small metal-binding protein
MKDCNFEIKGASSKDEVMQLASVHAKISHNMQNIPPDVAAKVSSAIKG